MGSPSVGWLFLLYPVWAHSVVMAGGAQYALTGFWVLIAATLCFGQRRRRWQWHVWALLVVVGVMALYDVVGPSPLALYLPPVLFPLGLAILFGRTLCAGRVPLIVGVAQALSGDYGARRARYARALTTVWTAVFVLMALEALVLATIAPPWLWSWMTNVVNYVILLCLFMVELCFRWWLFGVPRHPLAAFRRLIRLDWRRLAER